MTIPDSFHVARQVDGYTIYTTDEGGCENEAYVSVHDGEPRKVDVSGHPWEDMDDFTGAAIQEFQASHQG